MIVGAVFGVAWVFWGSGGLAAPAPLLLRCVAIVIAVLLIVRALTALRRAVPGDGPPGGSMFASRSYRIIVAVQVVALFAGNVVLNTLGLGQYVICWTAVVVGVHFIGFARAFHRSFRSLGVALVVIGLLGVVVGLAGGSGTVVAAVTGLGCGAWFLVGSCVTMLSRGRREDA